MKTRITRQLLGNLLAGFALLLFNGCASTQGVTAADVINAPFNLANKAAGPVLDPMLQSQANAQYQGMIRRGAMPKSSPEWQKVNEITQRIIRAVDVYQKQVPPSQRPYEFADTSNFNWEVNVIKSSKKNAFAMPGGKMAIYTGILPVAENDDGLAVIIGHEVAHVLMRHGRERVVKNMSVALALQVASNQVRDKEYANLLKYAGIGANVGLILPWSRGDEVEADQLGLALATIAGYNPEQAVTLWQNMSKGSTGAPPEFLSTHPSHATRIRNIQVWAPQIKKAFSRYRFP